jgi:D-glycero-alpha-D-manno-heptose-7-phosphate kinase
LGEPIGKQDQYAAAFGGLNVFRFNKDSSVSAEPIIMSPEAWKRMEHNLLMFYTGDLRSASQILCQQVKNIASDADKEKAQLEICKLTDQLHKELINDNIDSLGPILSAGWEHKRKLADGITNHSIDRAYEKALAAGAAGGKLLGAGGGGFLLFYVPEHKHNSVKNALAGLTFMEFGFSRGGTEVIYIGDKPKRG